MAELKLGQRAPEFALQDQDGKQVSLKDLNGKWVVLYAYPKDSTPGCTIEAVDFTKYKKEFEKLGAVILGISPDSKESHCRFIEKKELKITLLSDPEHKVLQAYNAWGMKRLFLKRYEGVIRSTFIISPEGNLAHFWSKVSANGHAEEVLAKLKELKR